MALEQLIPGTLEWDAWYANHIFRYQIALNYLKQYNKRTVLDAATGVGYGAHFLVSNGISNVVAIDRNEDALSIARSQFTHEAIRFLKDDCHTLKEAETYAPFDAVVSFETLEHLPEPDQFLMRCYAVLKPGGIIILSTPNALVSFHASKSQWHFHEKDYTPTDLESILSRNRYVNITLMGQAFSDSGLLRQDLRGELNNINSNPFMRIGSFLQKALRKHKPRAVLPEKVDDFKLLEQPDFESKSCFAIIGVAAKPGN